MSGHTTDVNRSVLRLSRLAIDLSEAIDALEDAPRSELVYADLVALQITSCAARLGALVYNGQPRAAA